MMPTSMESLSLNKMFSMENKDFHIIGMLDGNFVYKY